MAAPPWVPELCTSQWLASFGDAFRPKGVKGSGSRAMGRRPSGAIVGGDEAADVRGRSDMAEQHPILRVHEGGGGVEDHGREAAWAHVMSGAERALMTPGLPEEDRPDLFAIFRAAAELAQRQLPRPVARARSAGH